MIWSAVAVHWRSIFWPSLDAVGNVSAVDDAVSGGEHQSKG